MRQSKPRRVALDLNGLTGRVDIFRVGIPTKQDTAVEAWLNDDSNDLRLIARPWFEQMKQCGSDVRALMHDGCPIACVEDAPFAYVNTFTKHVNVGFFYGAMLNDPTRTLEGSGKRMRHVKLHPGRTFNAAALRDLIDAAYSDIKTRLASE